MAVLRASRYEQNRLSQLGAPPHERRGSYHEPGQTRNPSEVGGITWKEPGISIDTRNWGRKEQEGISGWGQNYPFYTGGTYLHPEVLPPVRTYRIQSAIKDFERPSLVNPRYMEEDREYREEANSSGEGGKILFYEERLLQAKLV